MEDLIQTERWLAAAEILLMVALLMVMARRGLTSTYRIFFGFMALQSAVRLASLFLNPLGNRSAYLYFYTTPVLWVLSILVVLELYENVLVDFPGILSFGKKVIIGTFAVAVLISLLTAGIDWNVSGHEFRTIFYFTFSERCITTAEAIFLLAMTLFLRWFPAPLKRNVHVHTVVLFLYFLMKSVSLLFFNLAGDPVAMSVNLVILAASCLCVAGWIWQFSPETGDRKITYRKVDPDEENRILGGLRAINETLLGTVKR